MREKVFVRVTGVLSRLPQAQLTIRATAHLVGIVTVLAVILPKAHRTNLVASSSAQSEITAARITTIRRLLFCRLAKVLKGHGAKEATQRS